MGPHQSAAGLIEDYGEVFARQYGAWLRGNDGVGEVDALVLQDLCNFALGELDPSVTEGLRVCSITVPELAE